MMVQQLQPVTQLAPVSANFPTRVNPWVTDDVLLALATWWVRTTRPEASDFTTEVALMFRDLQRDLQ